MINNNVLSTNITITCPCCGRRFKVKNKEEFKESSIFGFRCDPCLIILFKDSMSESPSEFKSIN